MKRWSSLTVLVGAACVATLLLGLATTVLVVTRHIEADATSVQIDAVPGLVESNALRRGYIDEYEGILTASVEPRGSALAALQTWVAACDARSTAAQASYLKTIHVDGRTDRALFDRVVDAREAYRRARDELMARISGAPTGNTTLDLATRLEAPYRQLIVACDELVAYNSRTGTQFASHMSRQAATLRWVALAVIVLVALTSMMTAQVLRREVRAARKAKQSNEVLALAFRLSPHFMLISRRKDARIIVANEAFRRHYGVLNENLSSYTAYDVGVWDSQEQRAAALREYEPTGKLKNFVKRRVDPDGTEHTLLISAERLYLDGEECLLAVGQDITDRIRAERALARSETELRTIVENTAIGIALVDRSGATVRTNPALEQFLGYTADEFAHMTFAQFRHPEDPPDDVDRFKKLVDGELDRYSVERRFIRKDGAEVWGHLTLSAVREPGGRLVHAVAIIQDVTERRKAAADLQQSESARLALQQQLFMAQKLEALGQLAGGVAHDFNNILAAITLHLDALKHDAALSPTMQESIDELLNSARRAAGLTRQLLLFSRREPAQRQVIDLNTVVAQLLKMLERLIGRQYSIRQLHPPTPLWINADTGMIEQVIMNLVINARDAMPSGGAIEITTDLVNIDEATAGLVRGCRPGRCVRLQVRDNGVGMNAAVLQRIFEPFFTTKPPGKGTGLGLATVFGIVQQHEGWVQVQSAEGAGTTFLVGFPAHLPPRPENAPPKVEKGTARGNETILVAEDNHAVRIIATEILRGAGYRVLEAEDGVAAKAILEEPSSPIHLLLADCVMPGGLLGHELAAWVAGRGGTRTILMSANASDLDISAFQANGGVFLSKPFNTERLLRVVRSTLDTPLPAKS